MIPACFPCVFERCGLETLFDVCLSLGSMAPTLDRKDDHKHWTPENDPDPPPRSAGLPAYAPSHCTPIFGCSIGSMLIW